MLRVLICLLLLPLTAHALESAPVTSAHSAATLVTEADSVRPGQAFRLGLRLKIQPGWHTYWSNPGDAGAPPTLDITGAQAGPIVFPAPARVVDGPFTSFVYLNEVLLPVTIAAPAGALHLQAHATWLVCEKLCVPEEATFSLDVPAGNGAPGAQAGAFAATDAATPRPSPFAATLRADGTLRLAAPGIAPKSLYFFPDDAGLIDQGADQPFAADAAGLSIHLKTLPALAGHALSGVLAMTDQGGVAEALHVSASPVAAAAAARPDGAPALPALPRAILLAFAGGLILNLMPCVLPILAMKALALTRLSGAARGRIRAESALYTAGVLSAFAAIGAITLIAGAAGGAAGWGVQFQSAAFTAAMAWLMLAIGLNFSGVFEVGAGAAGWGAALASRGSFFTGLLAVVVATPCTAPFMATALAAAVALPPVGGMAIFLALGAGLAAPYVVLAIAPGLARFLPRPGAWMETLKQVLAVPMYGAAAWLAWVVWQQSGRGGLLAVLAGAAGILVAARLLARRQRAGAGAPAWIFLPLGLTAAMLVNVATLQPSASAAPLVAGAERFSPARLESLRAAHRPVLVDMSAAWCITCLVNERVALSPAAVRDALARKNVALLAGDWTRQDPDITAFLHEYGRNGVPLYVYFPPDGAPQILPQILTQSEILGRIGA